MSRKEEWQPLPFLPAFPREALSFCDRTGGCCAASRMAVLTWLTLISNLERFNQNIPALLQPFIKKQVNKIHV